MSAITVWIDETEITQNGVTTWIIGQLITNSDVEELDFLKSLRNAHKDSRTWNSLHANEFTDQDTRRWELLSSWVKIFRSDPKVYFHAFVFKESPWRRAYPTAHDYWANQLCFGLANKMKANGLAIQTMFSEVDNVTIIMDRRSATTGYILNHEGSGITLERVNELEPIYEERIKTMLMTGSGKTNIGLRFSFANSRCFDGLQLCDCLTYMVRKRFLHENSLPDDRPNDGYLDLFNENFLSESIVELKDFNYDSKLNFFRAR